MKEKDNSSLIFVVISNIPKVYHSADLRNFFSEAVETRVFDCFHFRHRPAVRKVLDQGASFSTSDVDFQKTCCCIVRLGKRKAEKLFKKYHGMHWVDREGHTVPLKCILTKIKISEETTEEPDMYKTRKQQKDPASRAHVSFSRQDLQSLAELRPPSIMPNGNVGTPTSVFLELIRSCRMPARMIGKLGLVFPKIRGKRKYGSVPFDYGCKANRREESSDDDDFDVRTARGQSLTDTYVKPSISSASPERLQQRQSDSEEDDDECEEWERHEALHDDVTEQGRAKERLYEEEIELKWEKGGSGLVFYTDAQYWDELKGDFDEKTSDDWDVDTSVYYSKESGDKDAHNYVQMLVEERRRNGEIDSAFEKRIGKFEKHTRGIGRKLLEKQGWKDGQGLGKTIQGIPDALGNDGKHPRDKKGLGYHGEKQSRFPVKRPRKDILISTVYDKASIVDPPAPLLRRNPPTTLSHRGNNVTFIKQA